MALIITQDREVLYVQPDGKGTALSPLSIENHGMEDTADNTIPGESALFGRDSFGNAQVKINFKQTPGGTVETSIPYDKRNEEDFLLKMRRRQERFNVLKFFIKSGRLDNYRNWTIEGRLDVLVSARVTGFTGGAGPGKDFTGDPAVNTANLAGKALISLFPPVISSMTTTETEDINDITGLSQTDPENEIPGYNGPDKHLFAASDAASLATANVLYSTNGGASWAAYGADPLAADEHIKAIAVNMVSPTQYKLVALRETADAAAPCEIAYTTITLGDESTSPTWTAVNLGSTNNESGEALNWDIPSRLYAAAAGDIYVSTDDGESVTIVYTGANVFNMIRPDPDDNVWAVGASNMILKEKESSRGTFDSKVGPSGGGDFHSIAVADDGIIYAGNGTSIYRNNNDAASAGAWTALKDFGTNHKAVAIQCIRDNSQLLRAVVTDTTGNDGDVWYSLDGGNSWTEVADVTNSGYNKAHFSEIDDNLVFIAGEDNGSTGVLHKVSA